MSVNCCFRTVDLKYIIINIYIFVLCGFLDSISVTTALTDAGLAVLFLEFLGQLVFIRPILLPRVVKDRIGTILVQ